MGGKAVSWNGPEGRHQAPEHIGYAHWSKDGDLRCYFRPHTKLYLGDFFVLWTPVSATALC